MKYQDKSFSIGFTPEPQPEPPCPLCLSFKSGAPRQRWMLCKRHKQELVDGES